MKHMTLKLKLALAIAGALFLVWGIVDYVHSNAPTDIQIMGIR